MWKETAAVVASLAGMVLLPVLLWAYKGWHDQAPDGGRLVTLTGVCETGIWTTEEVNNLNYWRQNRKKGSARLVFDEGEKVYLRLKSADVVHSFSIPQLGVGPVELEAGHAVTVEIPTDQPGEYVYLCYTVCGKQHDNMKGWIKIRERGAATDRPSTEDLEEEMVAEEVVVEEVIEEVAEEPTPTDK